jgi:hypothetical protein
MKRNEILKLIKGILECPTTFNCTTTGAENILSVLEERGMLPPLIHKSNYVPIGEGTFKFQDKELKGEMYRAYTTPVHEWEDEDSDNNNKSGAW